MLGKYESMWKRNIIVTSSFLPKHTSHYFLPTSFKKKMNKQNYRDCSIYVTKDKLKKLIFKTNDIIFFTNQKKQWSSTNIFLIAFESICFWFKTYQIDQKHIGWNATENILIRLETMFVEIWIRKKLKR